MVHRGARYRADSASELAKHQRVRVRPVWCSWCGGWCYVELCIVKTGPETAGQIRVRLHPRRRSPALGSRALSPGVPGVSWRGCPDQEIMIVLHVVNIVGEHVKCLTD